MAHAITGLPGIKTTRTATPLDVLMSDIGAVFLPSNLQIGSGQSRDPDNTGNIDVLRAGLLLSLDEDNDFYAATILGVTSGGIASGGTTLNVTTQCATEINRRYGGSGTGEFAVVGSSNVFSDETALPSMEKLTHSAVNTTTGAVTIDATINNYPANSLVIGGESVRNVANAELTQTFILVSPKWGLKVTDEDSNDIATALANPLVGGQVNIDRIINYPGSGLMRHWMKQELKDGKIGLVFSDDS